MVVAGCEAGNEFALVTLPFADTIEQASTLRESSDPAEDNQHQSRQGGRDA